ELLSRDFTCNALLMGLDLKTIKDPIGMGISDIENKVIRTPISPEYTLSNDPKRIIRAINLSARFGFNVEYKIIEFVSKHPDLVKTLKQKYISDKLSESINYNEERTVKLIDSMKLWPYIPVTGKLIKYYKG